MKEMEQTYLDFISTVSHELRTPLTSIRGFADTLLTSGERLTPEQKEKFLRIIKGQSERLIKLVENLLTITKMQSEESLLVFKPLNVKSILEQTVQIIRSQYGAHTFVLEMPDVVPQIYVDVDKFQQIMVNLSENAAKYSPEGSCVTIRAAISESNLSIKVIDNGVGISQENYDKIFEKFARIDSPLTRKTEGSGLGLYITKNLVEKMNGKINVKSFAGSTVFEVLFPILTPELQAKYKMKENQC